MPNLLLTSSLKTRLRSLRSSTRLPLDLSAEISACTDETKPSTSDDGDRLPQPIPELVSHGLLVRIGRWAREHGDDLKSSGLGNVLVVFPPTSVHILTEVCLAVSEDYTLAALLAQTGGIYLPRPPVRQRVCSISLFSFIHFTHDRQQSPELERILDDVRVRLELARTSSENDPSLNDPSSSSSSLASEWASTRREIGAIVNVLASMIGVGVAVGWAVGETVSLASVREHSPLESTLY
jgi:hypothetical protein